jgi:hypothetical protein
LADDVVSPELTEPKDSRRRIEVRLLPALAAAAAVAAGAFYPDALARAEQSVLAEATLARIALAAATIGAASLLVAAAGRRTDLARAEARLAATVDAVPAAWSLPAVAAVAATAWYALGRAHVVPTLLADELIHEQAARQVAEHGDLAVHGYGLITALLDAVAFRTTSGAVAAFHAIQLLNVVVMVIAAVPAYLLARRGAGRRGSLLVAALTVTVAWMPYSAFVTTEAAFYPIFLFAVLTLVRALERPTRLRQLVLAGTLVVAFETRTQTVALLGGIVLAVGVYGWSRGSVRAAFRSFLPTWLLWAAGAGVVGGAVALGAGSPLGAYQLLLGQLTSVLHPHGLLLWTAANLTSIGLGCGALALIAWPLGLATLLRRGSSSEEAALAAASIGAFLAMLATVVALCESRYGTGSVGERNLFYVVPLVFAGAVAWVERGLPRPRAVAPAVLAAAVALAMLVPPGSIGTTPDSRTFALWRQLARPWFPEKWQMVAAVTVAAVLVARMRRGWPIGVAAVLASLGVVAANGEPPSQPRSSVTAYEWVDAKVPRGADATVLYVGLPDRIACRRSARAEEIGRFDLYSEFFNLRVDDVVEAFGDNPERGLGSPRVHLASSGVVRLEGRPLRARYLVLDARIPVFGRRVGELPTGRAMPQAASLALWRVPGTVRLREPSRLLTTDGLRRLSCAP